jgi:hypothetical protein
VTEFFPHVRGSFSIYVGGDGDTIENVRFVLANFGEDPARVVEMFWKQRGGGGDYVVVPLFGYGGVPRRELTSQQSLSEALRTVRLDAGGFVEKKWKQLCQDMNVSWPKRLQGKAA